MVNLEQNSDQPSAPAPVPCAKCVIDVDTMARGYAVHWGKRRVVLHIAGILVALALIPLAVHAFIRGEDLRGVIMSIVSLSIIAWFIISPAYLRRMLARRQRQSSSNREEVIYEVHPQFLRVQSKEGEADFTWSKIYRWKEGRGLILLYRHEALFFVVPTDQFDPVMRDALRSHLAAHCTKA